MDKNNRCREYVFGCKVTVLLASLFSLASMSIPLSAGAWSYYEICEVTVGQLGPDAVRACVEELEGLTEEVTEQVEDEFSFGGDQGQDDGASSIEGEEGIHYSSPVPCGTTGTWIYCSP